VGLKRRVCKKKGGGHVEYDQGGPRRVRGLLKRGTHKEGGGGKRKGKGNRGREEKKKKRRKKRGGGWSHPEKGQGEKKREIIGGENHEGNRRKGKVQRTVNEQNLPDQ